ncbi:PDE8A [Symbiodinium necroappetens]|uniref:PDE8A protein n=1 Tax=Symbiodinium necroappetens TaxID=1628268 RepID=A0A812M3N0_9DINO|nr:PDE8A [Symbiodinium necroappetens]
MARDGDPRRQWMSQQNFRVPLPASTKKALARLDGASFRTSYGEAFRHHPSLRNADLYEVPELPRSDAGGATGSKAWELAKMVLLKRVSNNQRTSGRNDLTSRVQVVGARLDAYARAREGFPSSVSKGAVWLQEVTTYSESFLPFVRDPPQAFKASPEDSALGRRAQEKIEKRKAETQERYWAMIARARALEEDNKLGGYMNKDYSATQGQGSLRAIEKLVAGDDDLKSNFVGGPAPIYWRSEAQANYTVDVHGEAAAQKYGLPTQPVPLAKFMKG